MLRLWSQADTAGPHMPFAPRASPTDSRAPQRDKSTPKRWKCTYMKRKCARRCHDSGCKTAMPAQMGDLHLYNTPLEKNSISVNVEMLPEHSSFTSPLCSKSELGVFLTAPAPAHEMFATYFNWKLKPAGCREKFWKPDCATQKQEIS